MLPGFFRALTTKASKPSAKVVSEIILKCSGNPKNIGLISRFFSHPHWKVRAASVAAMVDTAPDSVDEIKKQLSSRCNNTRICALKCLYELGMESWAKERLFNDQ